jgi:hypothetical protein
LNRETQDSLVTDPGSVMFKKTERTGRTKSLGENLKDLESEFTDKAWWTVTKRANYLNIYILPENIVTQKSMLNPC